MNFKGFRSKASQSVIKRQRRFGTTYLCNVNDKEADTLLTFGLTRYNVKPHTLLTFSLTRYPRADRRKGKCPSRVSDPVFLILNY